MTTEKPSSFYFCGIQLPDYSDYWWAVNKGLFKDYDELSFWEKQLSSYYNEIDWKLDKEGMPYSFDSSIFRLCSMKLLNHILTQKESLKEEHEVSNIDQSVLIDNLTKGLLSMIEISRNYETVWWISGGENEKELLLEVMKSSKPIHQEVRTQNIQSTEETLAKELRGLTQQKILSKETKRRISQTLTNKST